MTPDAACDQLLEELAQLLPLTPDLARASHVRSQCRAQLARSRQRSERHDRIVGFGRRVIAPGVLLGLCALYVASLVGHVLRFRGVF